MATVKTISTRDLRKLMDEEKNFLLLDVRFPSSFEEGHLPHAINIAFSEEDFFDRVRGLGSGKKAQIITYCSGTGCEVSLSAAEALSDAGYTNVYHYKEGMEGWEEAKQTH